MTTIVCGAFGIALAIALYKLHRIERDVALAIDLITELSGGAPQEVLDRVNALKAGQDQRTQKLKDAVAANQPDKPKSE